MKFLLDTHVLIWWYLSPDRLSSEYEALITGVEKKGDQVGVSIISLWESGLLAKINRLQLNASIHQWFEKMAQESLIDILPLSVDVVLESLLLAEEFPKDPADRFIVATARVHGLKLLTQDEKIRKSGQVLIA